MPLPAAINSRCEPATSSVTSERRRAAHQRNGQGAHRRPLPHTPRKRKSRPQVSVHVRRPASRPKWCSWSSAHVRNPYVARLSGSRRTPPDGRGRGERLPRWHRDVALHEPADVASDIARLMAPAATACRHTPAAPGQDTHQPTFEPPALFAVGVATRARSRRRRRARLTLEQTATVATIRTASAASSATFEAVVSTSKG